MKNKAVFLDRDGTINSNEDHYYVYLPEHFRFNDGVVDGVRRLNEAGYLVIVITNQGGVARGIYNARQVEELHAYMCRELEKAGARVDAIYYCPHHGDVAPCACRKPAPGMILQAIERFNIDPARSCMIGDSPRDVEAAAAAGVAAILLPSNSDITPAIDQLLSNKRDKYQDKSLS
ncbi:MAG: D-glycero-beta-D-manno-heptose 1,7-bisphosphate 7-phosphatase [Odoribacteraceae bacterium]|jgi:D-glycero-D-manno-heptose 1,7-bisphosphate phosphatase|nr:D-glycero-beta-D-manno-heptose 1,7-bisphosphate 7-phosphatase [Odoribacteraceae bacterium]